MSDEALPDPPFPRRGKVPEGRSGAAGGPAVAAYAEANRQRRLAVAHANLVR
jgi:hypothetical protein